MKLIAVLWCLSVSIFQAATPAHSTEQVLPPTGEMKRMTVRPLSGLALIATGDSAFDLLKKDRNTELLPHATLFAIEGITELHTADWDLQITAPTAVRYSTRKQCLFYLSLATPPMAITRIFHLQDARQSAPVILETKSPYLMNLPSILHALNSASLKTDNRTLPPETTIIQETLTRLKAYITTHHYVEPDPPVPEEP